MNVPTRLPGPVADALAERVLAGAVREGLLPDRARPDWADYKDFRARVREAFEVPDTSITPLMARVLYGIAFVAQPAHILVVGSYYGNTLVWLAGPGFGPSPSYPGRYALGVDVDATAVEGAAANFGRLGIDHRVNLLALDGHAVGAEHGGFDLVFLDADDPVRRKEVYLSLLGALYPLIVPGGLVLAHDICVPLFTEQLAAYRQEVRDESRFSGSVSFEIDHCGLEVSRVVENR